MAKVGDRPTSDTEEVYSSRIRRVSTLRSPDSYPVALWEAREHCRRTKAVPLSQFFPEFKNTNSPAGPVPRAARPPVGVRERGPAGLDQRYRNTPGWEPLTQSARLGWVSLAAALDINLGHPDYSVDQLGWRPKTKVIPHPVRPGILGVLQAQHNLVIRMSAFPTATNLRLVVDSQRLVSAHLVPFAARVDDRLAARWSERAETYTLIQKQLREIGGVLGNGASAAAEGANAVARLRAIAPTTIVEPRTLSGFRLLFNRVDHRIADVINEDTQRGAYSERVVLPHFENRTGHMATPVDERFEPISSATELAVVRTVNQRLRPQAHPTAATPGATRVELHAALTHRPPARNDYRSLGT